MAEEREVSITKIRTDVELELSNPDTVRVLVNTTFKALLNGQKEEVAQTNMRKAMIEGYMRGFNFKDFLQKNIYALPFKDDYTLVTSIDYSRKIGAQSGIVGKDAPEFETGDSEALIACTVTVHKRQPDGYIGDFAAKVYFAEYRSSKTIWTEKPRTMLAKVAEMHALRMACPAELASSYIAEEFDRDEEPAIRTEGFVADDIERYRTRIKEAVSTVELVRIWSAFPGEIKGKLAVEKDEKKAELSAAGK